MSEKCDCGAALTQCSSCAVADWQAAHPNCPTCCPVQPTPNPTQAGAARLTAAEMIEIADRLSDEGHADLARRIHGWTHLLAQIDTLRQERDTLDGKLTFNENGYRLVQAQFEAAQDRAEQAEQQRDAALTQVEKDRATAQREIERVNGMAQRASAQRDAALAALKRYGSHLGACLVHRNDHDCSCGLDAALKGTEDQ